MSRYLITGGTGFIGSALVPQFHAAGHDLVLLTRNPGKHRGRLADTIRLVQSLDEIDRAEYFDGIINLAGEGIADKRWTAARKQVLLDSRLQVTTALIALVKRLQQTPPVMISGSAVGWYGAQGTEPLDERSPPQDEFSHELCRRWEAAAAPVQEQGVRLCIVRLGPVLEKHGGMLQKLLPSYKVGLGGKLGSGAQMISWIHLQDVVRGLDFLLHTHAARGIYNLTAPEPVSNQTFSRALGQALHRPALLPMPGFTLKLLFGEMGDRLLLHGQNAVPLHLNREGFVFSYETIHEALEAIFPRK